jgi:hypothetical protein
MRIICPACGVETTYEDIINKPFCSKESKKQRFPKLD